MQAIVTKYLGPTNHQPGRIRAKAEAGSITVSWDHELGVAENHQKAAEKFCAIHHWPVPLHSGSLPSGEYAHVPAWRAS